MRTYITPFTTPPLRTHSRLPSPLNATDIGNSPSDEIGSPIGLMLVGLRGSIENKDTVLDPACAQTILAKKPEDAEIILTFTVARTLFFADTVIELWENKPSEPVLPLVVFPCDPRPPAATALSSLCVRRLVPWYP